MNIVCIGAHPDDAEFHAGGTLFAWARAGHAVHMVSMTNGNAGHHRERGDALARRRRLESEASARRMREAAGPDARVTSLVLDHNDGELMPTLEARREVVRIIRAAGADIVLSHRPWDYHPDHRYTAVLVQDAAFMVVVPAFCPETPALKKNPLFFYMMDQFTKPAPFRPDVAVDTTASMDLKWDLLDAMESQVYEWLPWLEGAPDAVPSDPAQRRACMIEQWAPFFRDAAGRGRKSLRRWYGAAADAAEFAELFEICEYGARPGESELRELFPFLP
jgi:N-acetylglucosamine malate deacetylase 1